MKTKTAMCMMIVFFGILPSIATATPGIEVTASPADISTAGGVTIDYLVTITNMDPSLDKTITSLGATLPPGWTYSFNPDISGQIMAGGNSISTTLHVTIPSGEISGIYGSITTADVTYELFPGCDPAEMQCIYPESGYTVISTQITEITPIPEFPTIALPIITVLGLMLFMIKRNKRNN